MQTALLFSGAQLNLIIVIAIVFAVLFVANSVLLALFFYKRKKSKLCTEELQQRREQLLEELAQLRYLNPKEEDEESEEIEEIDDIEEDADDDTALEDESDGDEAADEGGEASYGDILAVREMSSLMRERFGFAGAEFDKKRYYVRYSYSFEAKLRTSADEVKNYYSELMDEAGRYGALKTKRSFRHERIYAGRKTVAMLLFRGKTLCVALALNPADYADTKYRGKDVAHIKRFQLTPMLIKITSLRKLRYVIHLISEIAEAEGIERANENYNGEYHDYHLDAMNSKELFKADLIKIIIIGEAPDLEDGSEAEEEDYDDEIAVSDSRFRLKILAVRDMTPVMRERLGFVGKAFDGKRYYVRYSYGFEAKLRSSDDTVKEWYGQFVEETGRYKKLLINRGFRQQRLYCGRKTVGLILFKGKTLCVAFALNPKKYENTKYSGIDVSEIKRFEKTPMLVKITSARRLTYAKYLLNRLAEEQNMAMNRQIERFGYSVEQLTDGGYYEEGLLKITVIGEVPDGASAE